MIRQEATTAVDEGKKDMNHFNNSSTYRSSWQHLIGQQQQLMAKSS